MDRNSRGFYSITREEEIVGGNKPDIRVRHPNGVVSIEVKPLDRRRYTSSELKKTLESQLVAQYMRAANATHGILLLTMIVSRGWELNRPRKRIEFPMLIDHLNQYARQILKQRPALKALRVIGVDMTPVVRST